MKNMSKGKDMYNGSVKQQTPNCPTPKCNTGLKNNTKIRKQSK